MTTVSVHVEIEGTTVHAGSLFAHRRGRTESATFAYAPSYLGLADGYALDPELVLEARSQHTRLGSSCFGAFTDCSPDRWGRTLLRRQEDRLARAEGRTPRTLGEVDYLLGVRDDLRQGALRFRWGSGAGSGPFLAEEETRVPLLDDLPSLLHLAARGESDSADLVDLARLVHAGSSLGGARPKAHVRADGGALGIAKFPSSRQDAWNVMAWEKVAIDLAARAGIHVPDTTLAAVDGRSVLISTRFDRRRDGTRIGYASAMTMLEAADGQTRSYLEIAQVIEERSDIPGAELEQLWRRIVFSVLISNTDDHLRNHGFLHQRHGTWRLAPAFDLNPNPDPTALHLSTAIGMDDTAASLALAFDVAPYFRLGADQARSIITDVARAVATWQSVARANGLGSAEISHMAPAFAALDAVA